MNLRERQLKLKEQICVNKLGLEKVPEIVKQIDREDDCYADMINRLDAVIASKVQRKN